MTRHDEPLGRLAEFAADLRFGALGRSTVLKAKLTALDTIGVIVGGSRTRELQTLASRLDPGPSTLLGGGGTTSSRDAGLWNGTAGCVLELYEGSRFTRGPTAIQFLPAGLAEAERLGAGGPELLTALVVGYEVAARMARAGHLKDQHHPSGTWGVIGAAATVGSLRRADATRMLAVLDLAAALCLTTSLLTVREGATVRNTYAGLANSLGILAVDLVDSGFSGLIDGPSRIYGQTLCDHFDPLVLGRDLGTAYEIERGYFKRHACYRHSHAALDALDRILATAQPRIDAIRAIRVETYDFAARLTNPAPDTALAAQFSIPHALAARCVLGHAGPAAFLQDALADHRIAELRRRVSVSERTDFTAMQPARRPAAVHVELQDGRTVSDTVMLPRGEPEDPFSEAELVAKFLELAGPCLGEGPARALGEAVRRLDDIADVRAVTAHASGR